MPIALPIHSLAHGPSTRCEDQSSSWNLGQVFDQFSILSILELSNAVENAKYSDVKFNGDKKLTSMCAFNKREKLSPKLSGPALLGLDIWVVSKWSDVATDILSRHTPPHLKQLHGLKKRSAPDCSDYATSSTMAMCPSHRVMTPPILPACPISDRLSL